jgi:hypothetical protein
MKKTSHPSGIFPLLIATVLIALGLAVPVAVRALSSPTVPVINLDANPHTISMQVICDGEEVRTIETYVDGAHLMTTDLPPRPPTNLRVVTP